MQETAMHWVDILVEQGALADESRTDVYAALGSNAPDNQIRDWLLQEQRCTEQAVLKVWADHYAIPVLWQIPDTCLDSALVARLPVDWARGRSMLPVRWQGRLTAVLRDPGQTQDLDDLGLLLGEELAIALAPATEIQRAIQVCYVNRQDETGSFIQKLGPAPGTAPTRPEAEDLLRMADQAPVTQLVNLILLEALKEGASDIHIEPGSRALRMRFRIDGILYERPSPPQHLQAALVSRLKVMAHLDIAEKRMPQDGAARVRVGDREIDIRASTVPVADGERIVLRLLNRDATLLPLADLGMTGDLRHRFQQMLTEPFGVVWVTGPTGSGKTTTLYAALQELDTQRLNVITVEDPVEYQIPRISQIGIQPKIGLTFARGLRHILRQDPDVILVGETRDLETAEIVVRASLTGHLVFSTLHTNDALSAAVRLVDMGVEPFMVAAATRAAVAQRLVRRLCPVCRQTATLSDEQRAALGPRARDVATQAVWQAQPTGCSACMEGYKGRLGVFELLVVDAALQELIRGNAPLTDLGRMAQERGMRSLLDDGLEKVKAGQTSLDELLRVVGQDTHADV
jgi:general secretion pathway protein E